MLPDKDYPHTYAMGAQPNKSTLTTLDEGNALVGAFWAACGLAGCGVILAVGYFVFDAIRHLM